MLAVMAVTDDALLAALRGPDRDAAVAELHALLLRAARFELGRRRVADDDLAMEAADDALMAVLGKLDDFRGASRFTTWAYKFALLEAGVKARRRAWRGREVQIDEERWPEIPDAGLSAHERLEQQELLQALQRAVRTELTPAPARGVRRARAQRRPDRRARRAARLDAGRAVQDLARRPPQAPGGDTR